MIDMPIEAHFLGTVAYDRTYEAMQQFTQHRDTNTADALWICEHESVFTLGLAGQASHILNPHHIAVVQTDRGGQVTYHGKGQIVAYPLLDLKRRGYYVKEYVYRLEQAIISTLGHFGIVGHRVQGAPGIYVRLDDPRAHAMIAQRPQRLTQDEVHVEQPSHKHTVKPIDFTGLGKIAALGIKVSKNRTYHGLALNVAMDLTPFGYINPCGYQGLQTVDMASCQVLVQWHEVAEVLCEKLKIHLS